jgi:hypothetical protein
MKYTTPLQLLKMWVQRTPIDTKNILAYVVCSQPRHRKAENWPAEHVTRRSRNTQTFA